MESGESNGASFDSGDVSNETKEESVNNEYQEEVFYGEGENGNDGGFYDDFAPYDDYYGGYEQEYDGYRDY